MTQKQNLIIWDIEKEIFKNLYDDHSAIIMWNGYKENLNNNCYSILKQIQKKPFIFRKEYLDWVFSLNNIRYKNKDLINYFVIRKKFSFWAMSLFNEKCNFIKSPEINDAIKLIALEDLCKNKNIKKIILYSLNQRLSDCIKEWCLKETIQFKVYILHGPQKRYDFINNLYKIIKSNLWFILHIFKRWSLRGHGIKDWINSKSEYTFISYLINFNENKLKQGNYESFFWGGLPKKMYSKKLNSNWLHIWDTGDYLKSPKDVKKNLKFLNLKNKNRQIHLTLDSFLTFTIVKDVLCTWFLIILKSLKVQNTFFKNNRDGFNLNLLQKNDWFNSFYGVEGIKNILFYYLLDSAFKNLNPQSNAFYLQENQSWEFGLIYAWREYQKGLLSGVQHFTIRFWDLRYFFAKQYFNPNMKKLYFRPDKILVNSEIHKNRLLETDYPKKEIIKVEALRYNHLDLKQNKINNSKNKKFSILVLGDYDEKINQQLFKVLEKAIENTNLNLKIFFKTHPASKKINYIKKLKINLIKVNSNKVFEKTNFVLCSSNSSAALDVLYYDLPLAIYLNQKTLNLSPLNNFFDTAFCSDYLELKEIILKSYYTNKKESKKINYFNLDKDFLKKLS